METIKLRTHRLNTRIASDGLLRLEVPTDIRDVDVEVLVVISVPKEAKSSAGKRNPSQSDSSQKDVRSPRS